MNLSECLSRIEPQSAKWREAAREHIRTLTMPRWALGRLLALAVDLAGITRRIDFPVARKKTASSRKKFPRSRSASPFRCS